MMEAELQFAWPLSRVWIALALATIAALAYGLAERRRNSRQRWLALAATRVLVLFTLVLALADPRLRYGTTQSVTLAPVVLLDVSASMNRTNSTAMTHRRQAIDALRQWQLNAERNRSPLHVLTMDGQLSRAKNLEVQSFNEPHTDLAGNLRRLSERSERLRIGGVVIVTDGGVAFGNAERTELARLRARGLSVHVATTAPADDDIDIQVSEISAPERVFSGTNVQVEATINARNSPLSTAEARLEVDGVVVAVRTITLPTNAPIQFDFVAGSGGVRRLEVVMPAAPGEANSLNNRDARLVRVIDTPINVLHVEAEPRFEVKFLRRAIHDDPGIRLVSLVQTAENKFYRLGVRDRTEMRDGFPRTAAELFRWDVIVLGSVPAAFFSAEQMALLPEFVARRGGGVMFLGGRHAFAEGGHHQSTVRQMLPFVLSDATPHRRTMVRVRMARGAERHPVARLGLGAANALALTKLPSLTSVNASVAGPETLKLGARALWLGQEEGSAIPRIVLAEQAFGRGKVAAFAIRDSYRWQLDRVVPPDDLTHEYFWRQWLRWLAVAALPPQRLEVDKRHVAPGENITISVHTLDTAFQPTANGGNTVTVVTPNGERHALALTAGASAGLASTTFVPQQPGLHEFEFTTAGQTADAAPTIVSAFTDVHHLGREMFIDGAAPARVSAVANAGGGTVVNLSEIDNLETLLPPSAREISQSHWLELWNLPAIVATLLLLLGLEWLLRRRWNLP
jgi:hypothetical protein